MLLVPHIIIALGSIIYSTYLFFAPSKRNLRISYGLVGLTLASGTLLVVTSGARVLQACITGLLYLGVVSTGILYAHYELSHAKAKN